jgi:ectoine hydroxylase-related dioxygenase (phytanoyl-CoA dioxygenase family)
MVIRIRCSSMSAGPTVDAPLVSPQLVEQYRRDGFVVVDGLVDDDELDRFAAAVTAAVDRRRAHDGRALAEKSRYEQSFIQCMNLWEDSPDVAPLTFHQRIGGAAAVLTGVPSVRLWHDQALYKEPGGRATDAHQDQPYWPILETDTITAWIPFDGSIAANGAMSYVPGSHLVGLRRFINIFVGDPKDLLVDPAIADVPPVLVEVPRGSVAFHHGLTAHLAGPNTTPSMRRVHTMIYFADGSTRGNAHPHFAVDRGDIAVGATIDSDVTPIAFPRATGDLPPPPSA